MTSARETEVLRLKELGNACVKEQKYEEAMFHYTHAIKLDAENYSLYSNRSLVFTKMEQYNFAMEDAMMTIKLKPDWTKGYFRKAEVEAQAFRFTEALESYNQALSLQPNDPSILEAIDRATKSLIEDKRADQQIPWLGAGVGIILGVMVVLADYVFTKNPLITHPLLMVLLTMCIAFLGFVIAKGFRYCIKVQRRSLLDPPVDVYTSKMACEKELEKEKQHTKKTQARQRFKKEKS